MPYLNIGTYGDPCLVLLVNTCSLPCVETIKDLTLPYIIFICSEITYVETKI